MCQVSYFIKQSHSQSFQWMNRVRTFTECQQWTATTSTFHWLLSFMYAASKGKSEKSFLTCVYIYITIGYTGSMCETKIRVSRSTLLTSTTSKQPTIPTTTTTVAPTPFRETCTQAEFTCDGHYSCDAHFKKMCLPGYTGLNCTEIVSGGERDCDVFDG